ncbi:hypothetical protein ACU4GD_21190 [Cupriavidus basilensis]
MYFITSPGPCRQSSTAAPALAQEFNLSKTESRPGVHRLPTTWCSRSSTGGWVFGDRFGAKRTLMVCGVLWAIATLADRLRRRAD